MKVGITSDHRGYLLKERIKNELDQYEWIDFGPKNEEPVDYPDYAIALSEAIRDGKIDYGISICGSGIGMSICCNKVKKIRCARVTNKEDAYITRLDNNANMIAFSSNLPFEEVNQIINTFLNTAFSNQERHKRRIAKIERYENER